MQKLRHKVESSIVVISGCGQQIFALYCSKVWLSVTSVWKSNGFSGGAFVHGLLYVAGGRSTLPEGNSDSNAVDAYDPFAESWRSCTPMSVARNRGAAVTIDNLLYVVGGAMQASFHKSGERWVSELTFKPTFSRNQDCSSLTEEFAAICFSNLAKASFNGIHHRFHWKICAVRFDCFLKHSLP